MTVKANTVLCGDCVNDSDFTKGLLFDIPDNTFDLVTCDPPFNLGFSYGKDQNGKRHNDRKADQHYVDWCTVWLQQLVRVTKPTGSIVVCNIPRWVPTFGSVLEQQRLLFRSLVCWEANMRLLGNQIYRLLTSSFYGFLYYAKSDQFTYHLCRRAAFKGEPETLDTAHEDGPAAAFGPILSNVWSDIPPSRDQEHPCKLPVPLLERILLMTTNPGDLVLDCFGGGGTTGEAAKALGRQYVLIERNPKFVKLAERNIAQVSESKWLEFYVSKDAKGLRTARDADLKQVFV